MICVRARVLQPSLVHVHRAAHPCAGRIQADVQVRGGQHIDPCGKVQLVALTFKPQLEGP